MATGFSPGAELDFNGESLDNASIGPGTQLEAQSRDPESFLGTIGGGISSFLGGVQNVLTNETFLNVAGDVAGKFIDFRLQNQQLDILENQQRIDQQAVSNQQAAIALAQERQRNEDLLRRSSGTTNGGDFGEKLKKAGPYIAIGAVALLGIAILKG